MADGNEFVTPDLLEVFDVHNPFPLLDGHCYLFHSEGEFSLLINQNENSTEYIFTDEAQSIIFASWLRLSIKSVRQVVNYLTKNNIAYRELESEEEIDLYDFHNRPENLVLES